MPSGRRVRLTAEAQSDVREMLQFTLQRWGSAQRDRYRAMLRDTLRDLAAFPHLGRPRDDLGPGLRSHPVGQHAIFYRVTDDELIVRRIIHRSRDAATELGP